MNKEGIIHIGTSGWNYKLWIGEFYPRGLKQTEWLKYYSQHLQSLEINNSFYRLPEKKIFEKWSSIVPENFVFSVKASRFITHVKKLNDAEEPLNRFFNSIAGLGCKLGPVLFQLPPDLNFKKEKFCSFINLLPENYRYTFEFRNPGWWNGDTFAVLKENNLSFCIFELGKLISPKEITADFVYVRLHGHDKRYGGSYSQKALAEQVREFDNIISHGKDVYCYFDNDEKAYAAKNAIEMCSLANAI